MTQQNISLDLPKFEIKFCCNTNIEHIIGHCLEFSNYQIQFTKYFVIKFKIENTDQARF